MTRSAVDGWIERENPLNRIGRNMYPIRFVMLCLFLTVNPALAQQPSATSLPVESVYEKLVGRWVRLQGGYVITIRAVDADGKLDASYANPRPLPFHVAVASKDGFKLDPGAMLILGAAVCAATGREAATAAPAEVDSINRLESARMTSPQGLV